MVKTWLGNLGAAVALGAIALAMASSSACGEEGGGKEKRAIDPARTRVLTSSAQCALDTSRDFLAKADALVAATAAFDAAPTDPDKRDAAQSAWQDAMSQWQRAEMMQFGPAASSAAAVGGLDLRDEIYSWPLVSTCRVDQKIVEKIWTKDLAGEAVNARGMDAIEYLLFQSGPENECASSNLINTDGSWLAVSDLDFRRAAYAHAAAKDVQIRAQKLKSAWEPDEGNFFASLVDAGKGGPYSSQKEALNAVSDSLFYVELVVKDAKLAKPLGMTPECVAPSCPETLEHQTAKRAKRSIADNVAGFELLYRGCGADATGFDGLLRDKGAATVADKIDAALLDVHAKILAIEEDDLSEALVQDQPSVLSLYEAVKRLTDVLKTEFVMVLGIEIPQSVGGDND
jgi:predicted lipoprotein